MDFLRQYALTIFATALLCSVVTSLVREEGTKGLVRLVCGVLLALKIAAPLTDLELSFPEIDWFSSFAEAAVEEGEDLYREALKERITEEAEAYILDKAAELGADISAEVTLSREDPPVPEAAEIRGTVTPLQKQALQDFLLSELGIAKERQTWTG